MRISTLHIITTFQLRISTLEMITTFQPHSSHTSDHTHLSNATFTHFRLYQLSNKAKNVYEERNHFLRIVGKVIVSYATTSRTAGQVVDFAISGQKVYIYKKLKQYIHNNGLEFVSLRFYKQTFLSKCSTARLQSKYETYFVTFHIK